MLGIWWMMWLGNKTNNVLYQFGKPKLTEVWRGSKVKTEDFEER
jgi:hypothetical protein